MTTLIVGGTSGLGLELAKELRTIDQEIFVTGRRKFNQPGINYQRLDLNTQDLPGKINDLILELPKIDTLIYAAGYFQSGRITQLSEQDIEEMINVGGRGLIYFVRAILKKQDSLEELITITSTSQWTPRKLEPVYNFVKAGSAHFSNSIAEDGRVKKVLTVGPGEMNTSFWNGKSGVDLKDMLDPRWVAKEIIRMKQDDFKHQVARVTHNPAKVKVIETR